MASTSISDFKITVKLDSAKAMAGLRSLHAKMNAFANSTRNSLNYDASGVAALKDKVKEQGKLNNGARKYKKILKGIGNLLKISFIKPISAVVTLLGDWKYILLGIAATATYAVSRITRVGMAMQRANIAMRAAVAGSDIALGLSPAQIAKLQQNQLNFVQTLATTYGLGLTSTVSEYAKFFAASSKYIGVTGSEHLFESFAKLATVYGLTEEKQKRAMTAFTQMASKNQVMAEELKQQLGDVLPGSMEMMARAMTKLGKWGEVTVEKLYDMMAKGKIVASEVLPYFADEMARAADPTLAEALEKTAIQMNRLGSQATLSAKGIFNQYDKTLGSLIRKITAFLSGEGMQVTIGKKIESAFKWVEEQLTPFFTKMEEFEERWNKASNKEKTLMIKEGTFFSTLLKELGSLIARAWENLDLTPLRDKLLDAIQYAWDNLDMTPQIIRDARSKLTDWFEDKGARNRERNERIKDFFGMGSSQNTTTVENTINISGSVDSSTLFDLETSLYKAVNPYVKGR